MNIFISPFSLDKVKIYMDLLKADTVTARVNFLTIQVWTHKKITMSNRGVLSK